VPAFRSEIKGHRGAWLEAEAEARRASDELEGFIPAGVGMALYQIAEIRLRRGDLPAADEALRRAQAYNQDPEPVLSLLRHAQGETDAAASSIRRALDEPATFPSWRAPPDSDLYRLPLLAAQVEISLAAGDPATARRAADELKAVAARFDAMPIQATAAVADGAVLGAEGDPALSAARLREGIKTWVEIDAPYEAARGRVALADAYIGTDEVDGAVR
jgi:hypothetical protein